MCGLMGTSMDGWMNDGCMDGWMDAWIDGYMDGWILAPSCTSWPVFYLDIQTSGTLSYLTDKATRESQRGSQGEQDSQKQKAKGRSGYASGLHCEL